MARFDVLRKLARNEALIEYYASHPDVSLIEVGQVFGIKTRQRVFEIVRGYEKKLGHKIVRREPNG